MEAQTYYDDGEVLISSQSVKFGTQVYPLSKIDYFTTQLRLFEEQKGVSLRQMLLPLVLLLALFSIFVIQIAGFFIRLFTGTLVSESNSSSSQSWTDFVLPVASWLLMLVLIVVDIVWRPGPKAASQIQLWSWTAPVGAYKTSDDEQFGRIVRGLQMALRDRLHEKQGVQSGSPLYSDDFAFITSNEIWLMGRGYRIDDVDGVRLTKSGLGSAGPTKWPPSRIKIALDIIAPSIYWIISSIWIGRNLFLTSPTITSDGVIFPNSWLSAVSFIPVSILAVYSAIQAFRAYNKEPVYAITLVGEFGLYTNSLFRKKPIDHSEVYYVNNSQYAEAIVGVIRQALEENKEMRVENEGGEQMKREGQVLGVGN